MKAVTSAVTSLRLKAITGNFGGQSSIFRFAPYIYFKKKVRAQRVWGHKTIPITTS